MDLLARTTAGTARGVARDRVRVWKGIPYAAPPVGPLRFRPPVAPEPWHGERDCAHAGPVAMQARENAMAGFGDKTVFSEDCLSLNVFAPATGANHPVMVWIHGGAFIMGSGSVPLYDGASFAARHDLVVVTINYRLGLFGFLYLGDEGNVGLLDQVAALRWVRDNIAAFGGDPGAVTLMGESAGAMSIAYLLGMPAARGLFHRAVLESGAGSLEPPTRDDATAVTSGVLAELGATAATIADVPANRIVAAQATMLRARGLGAISPYLDGVTVTRSPSASARAGDVANVPVLIGTNRDEWNLFDVVMPATTEIAAAQVRGRLGADTDRVRAAYRSWSDLVGDVVFRIPAIRLAEAFPGPVYMYRFDVASPAFGGRLGAAHALELPLVWNQLANPFVTMLFGGDIAPFTAIGLQLHDTWSAFIRTGVPEGGGLPAWPLYDAVRRATLVIDRAPQGSRVVDDPGREQRELWPS